MYDIEALKRKMLVKYPFFGSVVANTNYKENNSIDTACTNGEVIYYNSDFLNGLDSNEQVFVFAHEVCHIAFNHILRSENKDAIVWNKATDAVINAFLKKDGLKGFEGIVDIPEAINYDAEKMYEKLLEDKKKQNNNSQDNSGNGNDNQGNSSNGDNQNGDDNSEEKSSQNSHSMWADAVKKSKNKDKDNDADYANGKKKDDIDNTQKKCQELGEKDAFKRNAMEKKKKLEELKEQLTKGIKSAGTESGAMSRGIGDIGKQSPLIDWRYILKEAIKYNYDWSYADAEIENGIIVPTLTKMPFPETEILIDTSGSIDDALLRNFLRECKNILGQSKLKIGCFDTKFYGFNDIRTEKDIENMNFMGGGGTDFNVAVNAFSRRVENKIIFTDGYSKMPQKALDAIWLVFGDERIDPVGGKVIYISNEQLNRLYGSNMGYLVKRRVK